MEVAKALIIIHPIYFIDLSAPKCFRKLECGSGVCVCVCDLGLTNPRSSLSKGKNWLVETDFSM